MTEIMSMPTYTGANDHSVIYESSVPVPVQIFDKKTNGNSFNQIKTVHADSIEKLGDDNVQTKFVNEYPTDLLVDRFTKYRNIIKALILYFTEIAYSQEQIGRINSGILRKAIKFEALTDVDVASSKIVDPLVSMVPKKIQQPTTLMQKANLEDSNSNNDLQGDSDNSNDDLLIGNSGFMKFGSGSIQDLQVILKKYHLSMANQQYKISSEILSTIIPSLESLKKDLNAKIKEIKTLQNDFKTNLGEHLEVTNKLLNRFVSSVKVACKDACVNPKQESTLQKPEADPYLLKLQLELQLKRQLVEENYLKSAFVNLQSSGMKLEKIVYAKIQNALNRYSALMDSEARLLIKNLCHELQEGISSKSPTFEWDSFIEHHPTAFMKWRASDPMPQDRKLTDIQFPEMKSSLAKCIRAGYLIRSSSLVDSSNNNKEIKQSTDKNPHYFILTSNYLHEFETSEFFKSHMDNSSHPKPMSTKIYIKPLLSISLDDCEVVDSTENSFTIIGKPQYNDSLFANTERPASADSQDSADKTSKRKKIGRLLKNSADKPQGTSSKVENTAQSKYTLKEELTYQDKLAANDNQDDIVSVKWTFFNTVENPNELELKKFKKWIFELKNLCAFNNSLQRKEFIEERLNLREQASMRVKKITSSATYSTRNANKLGRLNSNELSTLPQMMKINTPAIDDNGNLIVVGDRRMSHTAYSHSALRRPGESTESPPSSSNSNTTFSQSSTTPRTVSRSDYFNEGSKSPSTENTTPGDPHYVINSNYKGAMVSADREMSRTLSNNSNVSSTATSIHSVPIDYANGGEHHPLNATLSNKSTTVPQVKASKNGKFNSLGKWISNRRSSIVSQGSDDLITSENKISEVPIKLNQSLYP